MPYNTAPIAPPQEWSGTVSLPLARVKKIIHADDDIGACSNNAAFMIAVATEMFVQHMVEMTHNVVKSERRPRRNIQYRDVANAIARIDNLEFLADVVPRTITFKAAKERRAREEAAKANESLPNGQNTLDGWSRADADTTHEGGLYTTTMPINAPSDAPLQVARSPGTSFKPEFGSPGSTRTAPHTRPNFDAVRNGFVDDVRPGSSGAMEE